MTTRTTQLQLLRDLLNTLLDVSATLEDWAYLEVSLSAAPIDLAKALESPVFAPIGNEPDFVGQEDE